MTHVAYFFSYECDSVCPSSNVGGTSAAAACNLSFFFFRSINTKKDGMRITPITVAVIIPANTAIPITLRASAPAPDAVSNGTTPRMKANDVIRIGLKRSLAPSSAASNTAYPFFHSILANSTIRIAFFGIQANQHHQADLCKYVVHITL